MSATCKMYYTALPLIANNGMDNINCFKAPFIRAFNFHIQMIRNVPLGQINMDIDTVVAPPLTI